MCTILCVWAINSSCDRKMRWLENVPWESEKMQKASKKVWKVGNWEAESYGLLEGTQRRSFPNSSDERVGAIDESRLTLIRLSWHWDDSASFPPLRLHFVPHHQMIIDAPFISPRATEVCPYWGFPASLPPLRFLIKTLSTLKCSTTSQILFVRSCCLPPPHLLLLFLINYF